MRSSYSHIKKTALNFKAIFPVYKHCSISLSYRILFDSILGKFQTQSNMRFSTLTALGACLSLAAARIEGFAVPKTIKPGNEFDAILMGFNYIQTVDEIAAAFGVAAGEGYPGSLGAVIESTYLGPGMLNLLL